MPCSRRSERRPALTDLLQGEDVVIDSRSPLPETGSRIHVAVSRLTRGLAGLLTAGSSRQTPLTSVGANGPDHWVVNAAGKPAFTPVADVARHIAQNGKAARITPGACLAAMLFRSFVTRAWWPSRRVPVIAIPVFLGNVEAPDGVLLPTRFWSVSAIISRSVAPPARSSHSCGAGFRRT
jgi:hypothetical protein